MRTLAFVFSGVFVMTSGCDELLLDAHAPIGPVAGTDSDPRALTAFDEVLAGYGEWSNDEIHGTVWTPDDESFVPYATHGRFVNIDGRVVWLSELPWGAATLHHGRWVSSGGRWRWVPGLRFSSAWVSWLHEGTMTSWAPAAPTFAWRDGVAVQITPPTEPVVASIDDETLASITSNAEDTDFVRRWLGQ
jgi:hypothetical protein